MFESCSLNKPTFVIENYNHQKRQLDISRKRNIFIILDQEKNLNNCHQKKYF